MWPGAIAGRPAAADGAGERKLRALFDQQFDFCWRSLRRLGVPAEAIDDAAQEVFLVAANRIHDIQPGSERAFLFGTALRIASEARRARARRRDAAAGEEALALAQDPAPGPEELSDRRRARERLDRVLDAMPIELRTVFVLFELDGMTTAEIAACLELPAGTVASRLRRAREEFQAHVRRWAVAEARRTGP